MNRINNKFIKIVSLVGIIIIILFFVFSRIFPRIGNNKNEYQENKISDKSVSQSYQEIKIVPKEQGYQEIETILTSRNIEGDSPNKDVDNEIKRLRESGQVFWYNPSLLISIKTPMYYLQNITECKNRPEGKCSIVGLGGYRYQIPPEFKIDKCDASSEECLIVEPAFQKDLANRMSANGSVDFYGFGKDIYMIGSLSGDDNYSIFKNDKEVFTHKMVFITERFEDVDIVLGAPTFTFFEPNKVKNTNESDIVRNIWYKGETLNEKYGVEESSYLFSYKDKVGFVGKKNGKKFFFFNGQKISQDFDEIRSHACCAMFPYPIKIDENGILFFMAKRGEKFFLVEVNLNEYLK